jgi:uncharacterized membrane protein
VLRDNCDGPVEAGITIFVLERGPVRRASGNPGKEQVMQLPEPTTAPPADAATPAAPPPRKLAAADGIGWWSESWRIFCAAPGPWLGIFVLFIVISIALVMIPVVGSLVHTVLTPVFAGGAMLGCHALARGEPLRVGHLFEGFQHGRLAPLCVLGLIWLALVVVMAVVMVATIFLALGATGLAAIMDFGSASLDYSALASAGVPVVVVGLIALGLTLLAAMAYWFAPALVVLNGETPTAALQKSFAASMHNVGAFLLYGIIYIGLAIVASIPFGLGWLVLGPMIVGSCYAGWRTIFSR